MNSTPSVLADISPKYDDSNAELFCMHFIVVFGAQADREGGGFVRVMNKRQEFLWVHEKFAGEY